jgi:hypothetical protein
MPHLLLPSDIWQLSIYYYYLLGTPASAFSFITRWHCGITSLCIQPSILGVVHCAPPIALSGYGFSSICISDRAGLSQLSTITLHIVRV